MPAAPRWSRAIRATSKDRPCRCWRPPRPRPGSISPAENTQTAPQMLKSSNPQIPSLSPDVPSTVDADGLTGDEIALQQSDDRFGDLDLSAPSAERRGFFDRLLFFLARLGRRQDGARRDGVHEDVVGG